jgi:tetratricopeptide (TPR) repeat protein
VLSNLLKVILLLVLLAILIYVGTPKLASLYHNKGVEAYNNQLYEEAARFFRKSLNIMPNTDTYDYLAHTYEKTGKIEESAGMYRKLISQDPLYLDAYIALSNIYFKKHMFKEAIILLERAQGVIPNNISVTELLDKIYSDYSKDNLNKGMISYMLGEKNNAYYLLNKALELKPDSDYANYALAYCYYLDGYLEQAEFKLNEAIRITPGYWQAHKLLGDIFFKKHEYGKAINVYNKVLNYKHDDYSIYNDIGISYMQMENYGQAIIYLKEASRLNPDNPDIIYNLASTYRDAQLFDSAISEYSKLSNYYPGYPNMYNNLAEVYIAQGKQDLALSAYHREIKYAQQRLEHNPDNISELNNLARAYSGAGHYQRAKTIISKVIGMAPDYRDAYITLAKIEEKQNNFDDALKAFYIAKSLTAYSGFIDKYIADTKDKSSTSFSPADIVKTKKTFTPSHKILFKNGRSIEGIMLSSTEEEIILSVPAGDSKLKVSLRTDDIDRIEAYKQKAK